ncbi:MAG: hypothetical protein ABR881_31500, partial [Candidatus Sulfotelmatobacter sp.]
HFLDEEDARRFEEGFARCRARKLGSPYFRRDGCEYKVELHWSGIPTERNWLSYYALSLPEFAIPANLSISDPRNPGHQFRREIRRDDSRHRYVVYLECSSSFGTFDFNLSCELAVNRDRFATSEYRDSTTSQDGVGGDHWRHWLSQSEQGNVTNFFLGKIHMGDDYSAGAAGAMGPHSRASDMTFQQIWNQIYGAIDLPQLARELAKLKTALRSEAHHPEDEMAIGAVTAAEAAAKEGNGPKTLEYLKNAGKWAFDVATKIGVDLAVAAMKSSLGMS